MFVAGVLRKEEGSTWFNVKKGGQLIGSGGGAEGMGTCPSCRVSLIRFEPAFVSFRFFLHCCKRVCFFQVLCRRCVFAECMHDKLMPMLRSVESEGGLRNPSLVPGCMFNTAYLS